MAEQLNPYYKGTIKSKNKLDVANASYTIPGIMVEVTESYNSQQKVGDIKSELVERLRKTSCGTLIIAN